MIQSVAAEDMAETSGRYPGIGEHGVIGDLNTVALVSRSGAIDFFCFPRFDSPTLFASLLDAERGGSFTIRRADPSRRLQQVYLPETNVLLTRFLSMSGILEITDFMPIAKHGEPARLVRIVRVVRGEILVEVDCRPAFDYGRGGCTVELFDDSRRARLSGADGTTVVLTATTRLTAAADGVSVCETMGEGATEAFVLTCASDVVDECTVEAALRAQAETEQFWRDWLSHSTYRGRWREMVKRSALVLKLLTSRQYGSIVAAPTFSLPEEIGGPRNWDYRYCWIRDSAFTVYALLRLGLTEEASAFMNWVMDRAGESEAGDLQLMYRIDGDSQLDEHELDHLEGYMGSRPVRIGNGAHGQVQLDIYGELMDSVYLSHKAGTPITLDAWISLRRIVKYVIDHWHEADEGIWEMRGGKREFLHSRLMCWVAIDRAMRIVNSESLPAPISEWRKARDEIYYDIIENFWDPEIKSFVQHKGSKVVDAALLLMPLVRFISPVDPRWLSTLDRITQELAQDVLVHRYDAAASEVDGFGDSREGGFTMCSFWYIECLARAGRLVEARLFFEKTLSYANHLGLFSEELGLDGRQLGNFPQAFTHLALISAAFALNRGLDARRRN